MVAPQKFDSDGFIAALDAERQARRMTWKKVAGQAQISASTLTRLAQGRRPDVDSLAALCTWSGLRADDFIRKGGEPLETAEPLAQMMIHLRADKNLSDEGKAALEAILKAAYAGLRKV